MMSPYWPSFLRTFSKTSNVFRCITSSFFCILSESDFCSAVGLGLKILSTSFRSCHSLVIVSSPGNSSSCKLFPKSNPFNSLFSCSVSFAMIPLLSTIVKSMKVWLRFLSASVSRNAKVCVLLFLNPLVLRSKSLTLKSSSFNSLFLVCWKSETTSTFLLFKHRFFNIRQWVFLFHYVSGFGEWMLFTWCYLTFADQESQLLTNSKKKEIYNFKYLNLGPLLRKCRGFWRPVQFWAPFCDNSTGFYPQTGDDGCHLKFKNISGQVLTYNSKNFQWVNKKTDLERTKEDLGKPFLKQSDQESKKKPENQCQNAASENKKPLARNVKLIFTKN